MRRNYNKLTLLSFLLVTLVSCKKIIEVEETDLIAGATALKTVQNNEQTIIAAYGATQVEMGMLFNGVLSDELKVSEFYNAGTVHEWQYGSTDVGLRDNYTAVTPYYRVIDRVNRVLEFVDGADSTRPGDNTLRNRLKGEAFFLRAFCHFELFKYYCDNFNPDGLAMPYMETSTIVPQPRIKMDPYFQKMIADVSAAKNLLPTSLSDIKRATRLAATGLQARIALYMRNWASAESFATEYISAIPLSPIGDFGGIWTDANTNEQAWRLERTIAVGGRIGALWRAGLSGGTPANPQIGTITWQPSDELWNSFDQVNDVRFAAYLINEPILIAAGRNSHLVHKYSGTGYATTNENVNNAKVFRTGEMYLIRAEARAEQDKFTGANSAESDINTLRAARINGYVNEVFASKAAAITAIIQERFKELAFEGHRFWDLKRRGLPVERIPSDAPTTAAATLPVGNFRWLLPIPNAEIQASGGVIVQNPGYN
ncbi:MAG TPA: RagB/SusD family nutrient uptake outer membrane protein [Chitinophagaceae bacterium]|nr:RagB/SusD family nutrient uptake outer membrane protein [Chitinophagaceae bacterium]